MSITKWGCFLLVVLCMCDELHFQLLLGKAARKCTCRHLQHTEKMWAEGRGGMGRERGCSGGSLAMGELLQAQKEFFWSHQLSLKSNSHVQPTRFSTPWHFTFLHAGVWFYENFIYDVVTLSKKNEWWFMLLKCSVVWLLWTATQMCVFQWAFGRFESSWKIGRGRKSFSFLFGCTESLCCCLRAFPSCGGAQALGHLGLVAVGHTGLVAPHVESTWARDQTRVPCISRWTLILWTTREVQKISMLRLER